jgi:DNA-binding NarL/FixJ family response regulator
MRERAAAVGGSVDAGPREGGRAGASTPGCRCPSRAAWRERTLRVLLADDQALVLAGFGALLEAEDGIEVAGTAGDGEEAVALARALVPDVVLMDVRMPRMDGLAATAQITADPALADTRVVVLTTFELDEYVFGALRAGASGLPAQGRGARRPARGIRVVASARPCWPRGSPAASSRPTSPSPRRRAGRGPAGSRSSPPASARSSRSSRRAEQPRDRRAARRLAADGQDARLPRAHEVRRARRAQLVVLAFESGLVVPRQASSADGAGRAAYAGRTRVLLWMYATDRPTGR